MLGRTDSKMPVTITAVGATLNITIVDENFQNIQDFCRSKVKAADISGTFARYRVERYTGGRLIAAHSFANPLANVDSAIHTPGLAGFDITYRNAGEVCTFNDTGNNPNLGVDGLASRLEGGDRSAYAMELLGRPGPTLYHQWQEDGLVEAASLTPVPGWPPAYWPPTRYPKELLFSKWLTVPFASTHTWVDLPCTARVTVSCKGSHNLFRNLIRKTDADNRAAHNLGRFGIVVDTNPRLTTEFPNTNVNIKNPITGATAAYVSWKLLEDKTFGLVQRAQHSLTAEVALRGRQWYNFSMKFRDAAHHGWVDYDLFGVRRSWQDGNWESLLPPFYEAGPGLSQNMPSYQAAWIADAIYPYYSVAFYPPWINLWESASVNVEFFYGRDQAYTNDSTNAEFTSKPA